jgi:drug/metabolite transporter (DMT)-like permease
VALLIITTILWAFSFSLIGEYLAGHVDSYFSVLMRIGLAAAGVPAFPALAHIKPRVILLYMLVGAMPARHHVSVQLPRLRVPVCL